MTIGLLATCNAGGASASNKPSAAKWTERHAAFLEGRRIAIAHDNDEAGRRHAEAVAQTMLAAGSPSVRIITLPDQGDKEDVTDWLAKEHSRRTRRLVGIGA